MIRIESEQELLRSFRPMERDEVELPEGLRFPLLVTDYLTWSQASGSRQFLVFADHERRIAYGIVFKKGPTGGEGAPSMCDWCHATRGGNRVGLMTATASSKRRLGLYLCSDLSCREKVTGLARSPRDEIREICGRMLDFARQSLF